MAIHEGFISMKTTTKSAADNADNAMQRITSVRLTLHVALSPIHESQL